MAVLHDFCEWLSTWWAITRTLSDRNLVAFYVASWRGGNRLPLSQVREFSGPFRIRVCWMLWGWTHGMEAWLANGRQFPPEPDSNPWDNIPAPAAEGR